MTLRFPSATTEQHKQHKHDFYIIGPHTIFYVKGVELLFTIKYCSHHPLNALVHADTGVPPAFESILLRAQDMEGYMAQVANMVPGLNIFFSSHIPRDEVDLKSGDTSVCMGKGFQGVKLTPDHMQKFPSKKSKSD